MKISVQDQNKVNKIRLMIKALVPMMIKRNIAKCIGVSVHVLNAYVDGRRKQLIQDHYDKLEMLIEKNKRLIKQMRILKNDESSRQYKIMVPFELYIEICKFQDLYGIRNSALFVDAVTKYMEENKCGITK